MNTIARPLIYTGLTTAIGVGTTAALFEAAKNPDKTKKVLAGVATGVGTIATAAGAVATHHAFQQHYAARAATAETAASEAAAGASASTSTGAAKASTAAGKQKQTTAAAKSPVSPRSTSRTQSDAAANPAVAAKSVETAKQAELVAKVEKAKLPAAQAATQRKSPERSNSNDSSDDFVLLGGASDLTVAQHAVQDTHPRQVHGDPDVTIEDADPDSNNDMSLDGGEWVDV